MPNEDEYLDRIITRAQDIGRRVAYEYFVVMVNPKNQGPNWSWHSFPQEAADMAVGRTVCEFSEEDWSVWGTQIDADAAKSAAATARSILKRSGVLS